MQLCYDEPMKRRILWVVVIGCAGVAFGALGFLYWQRQANAPLDFVQVGLVPEEGVSVSGRYYASPGKVEKRGVILLHMLGGTQNAWKPLVRSLHDANYEVMTLDFRGHGESSGDWQAMTDAEYAKLVDDAAEAVEYLRDIDSDMHIAVVGASIGANVAVQLADRDPSISAVALLSPALSYHGITITDAAATFDRPIYFITSQTDDQSLQATTELYESSSSAGKQLKSYKKGGHGTELLTHQDLDDLLIDWFAEVL